MSKNILVYKVSDNLKKVDIEHECCSIDILPELIAALIDSFIMYDEIKISKKRMGMTNKQKKDIIVSQRNTILEKAKMIPLDLNKEISIDDGIYD